MLLEVLTYAQKTLLSNWSNLCKQIEIKITQNLSNKKPAVLERLIPSKAILFYSYTIGLVSLIFSIPHSTHTGHCAQAEFALISGDEPPAGGNIYPSSRSSLAADSP